MPIPLRRATISPRDQTMQPSSTFPVVVLACAMAAAQAGDPEGIARLERAAAARPAEPRAWYALGQAYNSVKQDALGTFAGRPEDSPWQQLLVADGLLAKGQLTDAFALYRSALERLPSMVSIHDSIAWIYDRTGHAAWSSRERAAAARSAVDCARRKALCEFRAGRYREALAAALAGHDAESRYWRARAATELSLAAFAHLEMLPDSPERRSVRAARARAEERYADAVTELEAALTLAPGHPALTYELASARYSARDYEHVLPTLEPLLRAHPDDLRLLTLAGYSLVQLQRPDEALPLLIRVVDRDSGDPGPRLALGRAYLQKGDPAAAVPLIEAHLAGDQDGSLHVQLARAYSALGQREKAQALLARSQELQRAAQERNAAAARRRITPPT